jgi:hypothetical protein
VSEEVKHLSYKHKALGSNNSPREKLTNLNILKVMYDADVTKEKNSI